MTERRVDDSVVLNLQVSLAVMHLLRKNTHWGEKELIYPSQSRRAQCGFHFPISEKWEGLWWPHPHPAWEERAMAHAPESCFRAHGPGCENSRRQHSYWRVLSLENPGLALFLVTVSAEQKCQHLVTDPRDRGNRVSKSKVAALPQDRITSSLPQHVPINSPWELRLVEVELFTCKQSPWRACASLLTLTVTPWGS